MRILCLQHVPFEPPAAIADWAQRHRHRLDAVLMRDGVQLPRLTEVDLLVLMGGPMSVHDETTLPWLGDEKQYLRRAIHSGKAVLGVCLGAQLIAEALGAPVTRNRYREIGWFPLRRESGLSPQHAALLPASLNAFHWHGETFALPPGTVRLASSAACTNQVFCAGDRILGLQCHLEATPASAQALVQHCGDELVAAPYVQPAADFLAAPQRFVAANQALDRLLDGFFLSA
ncbi:MAG: type 1 glutamine amidotransferase [Pseudomonadota bacterium]